MNAAYFRDPLPAALLLACGFAAEHIEEDWEDVGGPESGPKIVGHPAHTAWTKEEGDHVQEVIMVEHKVVDINVYPSYIYNY